MYSTPNPTLHCTFLSIKLTVTLVYVKHTRRKRQDAASERYAAPSAVAVTPDGLEKRACVLGVFLRWGFVATIHMRRRR